MKKLTKRQATDRLIELCRILDRRGVLPGHWADMMNEALAALAASQTKGTK